MSRLPELQAAVRALAGVGRASVRWPEPHGPATLHIVLETDADREPVAQQVIETLRDVGDVDLSSLALTLPPPPGEPETADRPAAAAPGPSNGPHGTANGRTRTRAAFSGLAVERVDLDNTVSVTLRLSDRTVTGRAEGLATRRATPRTAAAATLLALAKLLPVDTRVHLEWLHVLDSGTAGRPETVQCAVTCLSPDGEKTLIGSAIVRDDRRDAAVRATLDALNRRVEALVQPAT